jgi:class 3 adenylate cyclase/tetratricopeptide (TPR) repeat protein
MTQGHPGTPGLAPPERTARKTVTVLFSDVVAWSELVDELDQEATRLAQELYFEAMARPILRHGGTIEQYAGDAIYAAFGLPTVHEDDALRAVRAAVEMREELDAVNDELERSLGVRLATRTGVNTGEVAVGTGKALATGPAINLAKRFEQASPPNGILIGPDTFRLVRRWVEVEPVQLDVKGRSGPVSAYRIETLHREPAALPSPRARVPLIGRAREQAELRDAFDRAARERTCQLVTVVGPAGVGKSRLVGEVLEELSARADCLSGRCLPYGNGITFWPLAEVIRQATGLDEADEPAEALQKIAAVLREEDDPAATAATLAGTIGLVDADVSGEEALDAARKLVEGLARDRPLVVVFDDVHSAELTFVEMIRHIVRRTRGVPVLVVCMMRPELREEHPAWVRTHLEEVALTLEPLDDEESQQLIVELLGDRLDRSVSDRVTEAAAGNPLFVEEILEMLVESGELEHRDGEWLASAEHEQTVIPPTIQAVLGARLERLADDERSVLERGAVEGKTFHRGAVEALLDGGVDVEVCLRALERKELIRHDRTLVAGDEAFRFRHILFRDAAYQSLSKTTRADLHERYSDWLERADGALIRENDEICGYHLEQAHRYQREMRRADEQLDALAARAATRLASAGRRARARSDATAAVTFLTRSSALLPQEDPVRAALLPELGAALTKAGRLAQAHEVLGEALERARASGDGQLRAHALVQELTLRLQMTTDATAEATRAAADAVDVFGRARDDLGLCLARRLQAWVHWIHCRADAAEEAWREAAAHARLAGAERDSAEIAVWLATAALFGGTPAGAGVARCEQLLGELNGRPSEEALVMYPLAGLQAMLGRFDEARALVAGADRIRAEFGLMFGASSHSQALVAMLADDPGEAERCLRADYERLERIGETGFLSTTAALLARAVEAQERPEEAYALTEVAERTGAEDDLATQTWWRSARARILAATGRAAEAERLARDSVAIAEQTDWPNCQADAVVDLAFALGRAGRSDEATGELVRALGLYERKGNLVGAAKTRGQLALPTPA